MAEFTIKRSKWLRGDSSMLCDANGCMCVAGFACVQLGVPPRAIVGFLYPASAALRNDQYAERLEPLLKETRHGSLMERTWLSLAMDANDSSEISDTARERKLKGLFKREGHTLTFVD